MPWQNGPDDRRQSDATYSTPEYRRNRDLARRRAAGRCEGCGHRHSHLQCDHKANVASGRPDHSLANLQMLCTGPPCKCHEKKTAAEGNAGRQAGRPKDPPVEQRTAW